MIRIGMNKENLDANHCWVKGLMTYRSASHNTMIKIPFWTDDTNVAQVLKTTPSLKSAGKPNTLKYVNIIPCIRNYFFHNFIKLNKTKT